MIRPAVPEDAAGIAAIWNPIIRDTIVTFTTAEKTEDELRAAIATQPFIVAASDDGIEGFTTCFQFRKGPGYAHTMEHTILLTPAARGHGLGRALMDAICEAARGAGAHSLFAGVSGENSAGIAFHAAIGFSEAARLSQVGWKFGRWHDLVLMQKFL
ncbi:GNAT family N-acetyltransferase [Rhodobacterales bacterium HKCCE3408]|nr:GNAT family N-acetyltransferase [Rhodobacterales bacterium HKCCE3408]